MVARSPFSLKERGGNIRDEEGENIQGDEELKEAFVRYNLKTEPREPEENEDERVFLEEGEEEGERQSERI